MDNKITIIEGPTPTFEPIQDSSNRDGISTWTASILEGPFLFDTAFTTLRTFNSQSLLDRCSNAWNQKQTMFLEYHDRIGLTKQSPIIAARAMKADEGELLLLWVRKDLQEYPELLSDDDLNEL